MEITLQVDPTVLADDLHEVLESMTMKQKQKLSFDLLKGALKDTETEFNVMVGVKGALKAMNEDPKHAKFEREFGFDEKGGKLIVAKRGRSSNSYSYDKEGSEKPDTEEQRMFERLRDEHATPVAYFRRNILPEMLEPAVARTKEMVEESPVVQKAIKRAVEEIENKIPRMIENAMRELFVKTLRDAITSQSLVFSEAMEHKNLLGEITNKLEGIEQRLQRNNVY